MGGFGARVWAALLSGGGSAGAAGSADGWPIVTEAIGGSE